MGKADVSEQGHDPAYEMRRFAEMVHTDRERRETLARVRAEFARRAREGDPDAKGVVADLDRNARGDDEIWDRVQREAANKPYTVPKE